MTLHEFLLVDPVFASRSESRCLLCGDKIRGGESMKDLGIYDRVHSGCLEFAGRTFERQQQVTFGMRKAFIAARTQAAGG